MMITTPCAASIDELICMNWLYDIITNLDCLDCPDGMTPNVSQDVFRAELYGGTGIVVRTRCDFMYQRRRFFTCDGTLIYDCVEATQVCDDWNDDILLLDLMWSCNQGDPDCSDCEILLTGPSLADCNTGTDQSNPDDDFLEFDLDVTATGSTSTSFTISSSTGTITPGSQNYGQNIHFALAPGTAGGGTFTVTVADANFPSCTESIFINDPGTCSCSLNTAFSQAPSSCNMANGSATIQVWDNTPPFSFDWDNGFSETNSTGTSTNNNILSGIHSVTVEDGTGCVQVYSIDVLTTEPAGYHYPIVDLGIDFEACLNTLIQLNALDPDCPGCTYSWHDGSMGSTYEQNLTTSFQASVIITDPSTSCSYADTLTVMPFPAGPFVSNIQINCEDTQAEATVSFDISGGSVGNYLINGMPYGGTQFESQVFNVGDPFNFSVTDVNGCENPLVEGNISCDCPVVGSMDQSLIEACGNDSITVLYDNTGEDLGSGLLEFILHDSPGSLGTIFIRSASPDFPFADMTMDYETTYYISAVAGFDDGTGRVDLLGNCLDVAIGTPVIWHKAPRADIQNNMDVDICANENYELYLNLSGQLPITMYYSINGMSSTELASLAGHILVINSTEDVEFILDSISNTHCSTPIGEAIQIDVTGGASLGFADAGSSLVVCSDSVILSGNLPANTDGEWSVIGNTSPVLHSPTSPVNLVSGLSNGINQFVWSLSTFDCPDYDADTVDITYVNMPEANHDIYTIDALSVLQVFPMQNDQTFGLPTFQMDLLNIPYQGMATVIQDEVHYESQGSFFGSDTIYYSICSMDCPSACDTSFMVFQINNPFGW